MAKQGEAEVSLENKRSAVSLVIHKKGKEIDCHEFDKSNSRNDEISSYNVGIIDCHANSLRSFARNDGKAAYNDERLTHPQTPSASEGAFKVAPHTHNAKSANNDNQIVIASKSQDLRGNPKSNTIDTKNGLPRGSLRILSQ